MPNFGVDQLFQSRCKYSYPPVTLEGSIDNLQHKSFQSTLALDKYFYLRLHSNDCWERVLGYLGIVYWGHYSGQAGRLTPERALGKVQLLIHGIIRKDGKVVRGIIGPNPEASPYGLRSVCEIITAAKVAIDDDRYGDALKLLCGLPGIQVAFASKICAFLNPSKCGVIDKVIASKYPTIGMKTNKDGFIKNVRENFVTYQRYCCELQGKAALMNKSSKPSWIDIDGGKHEWRAVDVERALYLI